MKIILSFILGIFLGGVAIGVYIGYLRWHG